MHNPVQKSFSCKINCTAVKYTVTNLHKRPELTDRARSRSLLQKRDSDSKPLLIKIKNWLNLSAMATWLNYTSTNMYVQTRAQLVLRWPRIVAQLKFSLSSGVPLLNAFVSVSLSLRTLPHRKLDYVAVACILSQTVWSIFNRGNLVAPKATEFGEITQNKGD